MRHPTPHLTLIERLDRHLLLRSRVESLLAVVEGMRRVTVNKRMWRNDG